MTDSQSNDIRTSIQEIKDQFYSFQSFYEPQLSYLQQLSYQTQISENIMVKDSNQAVLANKQSPNTTSKKIMNNRQSYLTGYSENSKISQPISQFKGRIVDFQQATKQLQEQASSTRMMNFKKKFKNQQKYLNKAQNVQGSNQQQFNVLGMNTKKVTINNCDKIEEGELDLEKQIEKLFNKYSSKNQKCIASQIKMKKSTQNNSQTQSKYKIPQIDDINCLQTLIGRCYIVQPQQKEQPRKCKYEINIRYFCIQNVCSIQLKNIIHIKIIKGAQNTMMMIKIRYKKDKDQTEKGSLFQKQGIKYICENPQVIYTIFSSIIVRRILIQRLEFQSRQSAQKSIDSQNRTHAQTKIIQGTLAVTSFMLGRQSVTNSQSSKNRTVQTTIGHNYNISEMIFKKSKHLKKWQRRFIQIKDHSLNSFRPQNIEIYDDKNNKCLQLNRRRFKTIQPSIAIARIQELWTRFQFYQPSSSHRKYLIVKSHHWQIEKVKTEIAIPIVNYANILIPNNWLYGLYMLFFKL